MSIFFTLFPALVTGLAIGAVARLFVPERRRGLAAVTITLGVVGAVLAALIGHALDWYEGGLAARFLVSMLGALALPTGYRLVTDELARARAVAPAHSGHAGSAP